MAFHFGYFPKCVPHHHGTLFETENHGLFQQPKRRSFIQIHHDFHVPNLKGTKILSHYHLLFCKIISLALNLYIIIRLTRPLGHIWPNKAQNTNCIQLLRSNYKISKKEKQEKPRPLDHPWPRSQLQPLQSSSSSSSPAPIHSLSVSKYGTFFSISHSLLMRVANLRAERGDISGANRAKAISQKLQRGPRLWLGCWGLALSLGWDYVKNYAWSELDYRELYDAVSDLNELSSTLSESLRLNSEIDRVAWAGRNYGKILVTSKRLFARLLKVFRQPGPLREVVEAVQREVLDGDLLRDCLDIGSNDLKGLMQIIKDFVLQYYLTLQDQDDWSDL